MSRTNETNPEDKRGDFNRELYRLLLFYRQLTQLLETFFSGDLIIPTDELNRTYLRLCNKIEEIIEKRGFEDLARHDWQPFDNLRALDPDAPDLKWEYGGQQVCSNFLSAIEKLFISAREKTYPLDIEDQQLLTYIQTYLGKYRSYKKDYEKKWLQKVEKQAEDWKKREEKTQVKMPQFDFKFIRDREIKNLLTKDKEILTKLDTIATTQDEIKEITLKKIQDGLIEISSPGIKETLKIKLSTPGSGIIPVTMEKETTFDLGKKRSYDDLKKDLEKRFGGLGSRIFDKLKSKNWIKK